ncbi:unnamed protein product [Brachionus calyciflorus]|uniref:Uncharacterized protein n=1 Tax=Brachionus calyciflorus TaxID=104777 RepID=A0A813MBN5_9BILA|nr:unnamed protein product [Brachionus calyciflorus]
METPTNDRVKPRLSSSSSSAKKGRKSLDNSASKLVKQLIQKEKLRKLRQYKIAKIKRADILVKNRHIDDCEPVEDDDNQDEKIEIDEQENKENFSENNDNFSVIHEEPILFKSEPMNEVKQSDKNNQEPITSKISSNILRRINSFKSSIKSIVNSSNSKLFTNSKLNPPIKQESLQSIQKFPQPIKVRRSISMGGFPNQSNLPNKSCLLNDKILKKQESTSSVQFNKPFSSSGLYASKSSLLSSSSSLSLRSQSNSSTSSIKPVFKVSSKIQYNDAYLYKNEVTFADKQKYQKLIKVRKIAKTSTASLDEISHHN